MEMTYAKPIGYNIQRRTFEGKTDPAKNNSSLTSKYMPSYKYWVKIDFDGGYSEEKTFTTKAQCIEYVDHRQSIAGRTM